MGIRCYCPNGHKLNLKTHLAGERGICPECGARFSIPVTESDTEANPTPIATPSELPPSGAEPPSELQEIEEPLDIGRAPLQNEPIKADPEPTLLPPKIPQPTQDTPSPPPSSLPSPQNRFHPDLQPDQEYGQEHGQEYGLSTDRKNFDVMEGFGEMQRSDQVPKIVTEASQPITTMRTRTKKHARNTATFLLGMATIILIIILFLVL